MIKRDIAGHKSLADAVRELIGTEDNRRHVQKLFGPVDTELSPTLASLLEAEKLLTEASIGAVLDGLGLARYDEGVSDLTDELRQLAATDGTVGMITGAVAIAERHGFARALGAWLADALLAQRLGWAHAVPLLGAEAALGTSVRPRRSAANSVATGIETDPERAKSLLAAQARAAPKLRAKAADLVVDKLLSDDAIVASEKIAGRSGRGLRRLFDRLVELGAVRELSGRPTFRIYGL
ncbi:DUF1403 family protein [Mesorhizobium sp.]|uniref:DUF1403 family protein n=1 Tax=Mesorhizobium sp. TaxID=1871066 RepID=UPI003450DC8C